MKDIRFNISLYIIIPIIFGGIALLTTIGCYNIILYNIRLGVNPETPVLFFGTSMIAITFFFGLLIAKLIIGPVERFVRKTEELGILDTLSSKNRSHTGKKDELGRYALVFDQVTELLSRVESRKLFPKIIGESKSMRGVFNQIIKVAATDSTVLIMGETGTGKELIAQSIHDHSQRSTKPFIAINCAAIPAGLLESELFGHEKGAFTGAESKRIGKFESANGGTLFLDEIGDMPPETQAKILRILQESRFERVGGSNTIKVNVRFIAATNKDLSKMVDADAFRQDLYYRLNVFTVHLPPLRERKDDISLLIKHFLKEKGKNIETSASTMDIFSTYHWPGNVRELKNVLEAASVLTTDLIEPAHIPSNLARSEEKMTSENSLNGQFPKLEDHLQKIEKNLIIDALHTSGGIQVRAAKLLGIKERSLWHRIKKLKINVDIIKEPH